MNDLTGQLRRDYRLVSRYLVSLQLESITDVSFGLTERIFYFFGGRALLFTVRVPHLFARFLRDNLRLV